MQGIWLSGDNMYYSYLRSCALRVQALLFLFQKREE